MQRAAMAAGVALVLSLTGCTPIDSSTGSSGTGPAQAGSMGAPARDGKFEFTVTAIKRAHTVVDPTNPYANAQARGEFIIVYLTVKDAGDEAQTYFVSNQKLVSAGKQYSASFEASALMSNNTTSQINPGLAIDTSAIFDVPVGTVPDSMELHDSALSRGVIVNLRGAPISAS